MCLSPHPLVLLGASVRKPFPSIAVSGSDVLGADCHRVGWAVGGSAEARELHCDSTNTAGGEDVATEPPPGSPAKDSSFSCSSSSPCSQDSPLPVQAVCLVSPQGPCVLACSPKCLMLGLERHYSDEGHGGHASADQRVWSIRGFIPISSAPTHLDGLALPIEGGRL